MLLDILQIGAPVLRQTARPLTLAEIHSPLIQQLIEDMRATMYAAPGVGLAAPQVGHDLQLIVVEDQEDFIRRLTAQERRERQREPVPYHVLINPKLTVLGQEMATFFEGCLSISGLVGLTPRALAVQVECLNEKAEPVSIQAQGWYARILQHEIDHLQGCLCVDRMHIRSLMTFDHFTHYWRDKPVAQVLKEWKFRQKAHKLDA